jgi:hypothetical protein
MLPMNVSNEWTINAMQHSGTSKTSTASVLLFLFREVAAGCHTSIAYVNMISIVSVLQSFRKLICEGGGSIWHSCGRASWYNFKLHPKRCNVFFNLFILKTLYMFRAVPPPIIKST